jgi:hypothetical protein
MFTRNRRILQLNSPNLEPAALPFVGAITTKKCTILVLAWLEYKVNITEFKECKLLKINVMTGH